MSDNVVALGARSKELVAQARREPDAEVIKVLERALEQAKTGELRGVAILKAMHWEDGETGFERVARHTLWWHIKEMTMAVRVLEHEWAKDAAEHMGEHSGLGA